MSAIEYGQSIADPALIEKARIKDLVRHKVDVEGVLDKLRKGSKLHPATKTFIFQKRKLKEIKNQLWGMHPLCDTQGFIQNPLTSGEAREIDIAEHIAWLQDGLSQSGNKGKQPLKLKLREARRQLKSPFPQ